MKITKLTPEQEAKIPGYIEKYLGLACGETNREEAVKAVKAIYKNMGEKEPIVIFGESPMSTALLNALAKTILKIPQDSSQLYSQLDSQLYSQLNSQLDSQLRSQLKNINSNGYLCVWWLSWAGWYSFGKYIGVKFNDKAFDLFTNFVENVFFIIPYKGIVFVSDKPKAIHWKNKMLHNEKGRSVEFADGYGIYSLNGVSVPEWLVMTAPSDLKPEDLQREELKNVEVRREFIRKIGIDRMVKYGEVIHEDMGYKLIDMKKALGLDTYSPYLMMQNPSIGVFHLEGVDEQCKTVKQALSWRNQTEELPMVLT